jgi:ribonuclease HI
MKKSDYLRELSKLKKIFIDDDEASLMIDILEGKVQKLEFSSGKRVEVTDTDLVFSLPSDFSNLDLGFAVFTDGACRGNPGPGAYALLIQNAKGEIILKSSGVEMPTTNNKMEMQAVISALLGLFDQFNETGFSQTDAPIYVYSDSKYVIDGIKSWVPNWKARGWKKADNKEPENIELWKELDRLTMMFKSINFNWVKGHNGHPQNEYCDKLCNLALDEAGF